MTAAFHADIRVGSHVWACDAGDTADPDVPNVLAGATFTWAAPDNVGWPPPLHTVERDVLTLQLFTPDAADVGDVRRGDLVRFTFTPTGHATPLVDFAGRVRAVKVVARDTFGAYLQLTAADHTVALQDWSVPGETVISADGDTQENTLDRIAYVLNVLTAGGPDLVPGGFADPLPTALDPLYVGTVQAFTIPTDQAVSAFELFATYGFNMMPIPHYDPVTGELDHVQPFRIAYLDPAGRYWLESTIDACLVPTGSVDWQRDYIPNVIESPSGRQWVGETYGAHIPPYPDWNLLRLTEGASDLNLQGFLNERPEPDPWGPYTFTILGWRDPAALAAPWLTVPDRYRLYVTLEGIDPAKSPNGADTVSGMLRSGSWTIDTDGRWTITAGLRPSRGDGIPFSDTWDAAVGTWDAQTATWDTW